MAVKHNPMTIDRGVVHIHRFTASCSCGWRGVHRRRRKTAMKIARSHVRAEASKSRPSFGISRPLTPHDRLPESLR